MANRPKIKRLDQDGQRILWDYEGQQHADAGGDAEVDLPIHSVLLAEQAAGSDHQKRSASGKYMNASARS